MLSVRVHEETTHPAAYWTLAVCLSSTEGADVFISEVCWQSDIQYIATKLKLLPLLAMFIWQRVHYIPHVFCFTWPWPFYAMFNKESPHISSSFWFWLKNITTKTNSKWRTETFKRLWLYWNKHCGSYCTDFFPAYLLIKKSLGFKIFESDTAHLLFQDIYLCNRK